MIVGFSSQDQAVRSQATHKRLDRQAPTYTTGYIRAGAVGRKPVHFYKQPFKCCQLNFQGQNMGQSLGSIQRLFEWPYAAKGNSQCLICCEYWIEVIAWKFLSVKADRTIPF